MANKWRQVTIGDIANIKHGFAFKGEYFAEEKRPNVLVTPGNFSIGGGFQTDKLKYYDGPVPEDYVLSKGDLVVTMTDLSKMSDTLGYGALIPETPGVTYLHNQRVGLVQLKDENVATTLWLHYLLRTYAYRAWVVGSASGTTVKHTSPSRIESYAFALPPIEEQRAIVSILGALDDKIELNRRTNETLETITRALFKSWFIDFDGIPAEDMQESELGLIPKGWEVASVKDIGSIVCGKTPSTKTNEYYGDDIPFITIPEMHGNIFAINIQKRLSHAGANSQTKKMLPAGAICVSCIATLGLVTITTEPSQTNQQINSVIPTAKDETYFWYWSLNNLGEKIKAGASGGSVLGNLSTGRFSALRVNAATKVLRSAYHANTENLFSKIKENERQTQVLAALRDTLLPKLLSGELRSINNQFNNGVIFKA